MVNYQKEADSLGCEEKEYWSTYVKPDASPSFNKEHHFNRSCASDPQHTRVRTILFPKTKLNNKTL